MLLFCPVADRLSAAHSNVYDRHIQRLRSATTRGLSELPESPAGQESRWSEYSRKGDRAALRLQNQLNFLSTVRNDLHIAEFFETIFAEFNANPQILMTTEPSERRRGLSKPMSTIAPTGRRRPAGVQKGSPS